MAPKHIMVIDDDWMNRELMEAILTSSGYTVTLAHSGPDALKKITTQIPDLFLIDVLMPDMDGFAVYAKLKEDPRTASIPVFFTTALEMGAQELSKVEATGAAGVLNRSMSTQKIVDHVTAQLNQG